MPIQGGMSVADSTKQNKLELGNPLDILKALTAAYGYPEEQINAANQLDKQDQTQQIINQMMKKAAEKNLNDHFNKSAADVMATQPDGASILASILASTQVQGSSNKTQPIQGQPSNQDQTMQQAPIQSNQEMQSNIGNQVLSQTQQAITPEKRTVIGGLLNALGNITGYNMLDTLATEGKKGEQLNNLSKAQKIAGQEFLQSGEREKLGIAADSNEQIKQMDIQADMIKTMLKTPDALSPEMATKFTILLDGQKATKEVANMLNEEKGIPFQKWSPNVFKSDQGKKFKSSMLRMIDAKSRSESGAAISEKEFDREFNKFGINVGDSKEVVRSKLAPLYEWYSSALNMSDPTGVQRQRASGQQFQQSGILDAIQAEKKRRGL